jgi:CHASE3 domain sensor protein
MDLTSRLRPRTLRWRVYSLVGILLCLLVGTVAATLAARHHATTVGAHVRDQLRPAQVSVAAMTKGYVDMETGLRGYLLTRNPRFLDPYDEGAGAVARSQRVVSDQLADDPTSLRLLDDVSAAGNAWVGTSATPLIDAARAGTLTTQAQADSTAGSKPLFDDVRVNLAELQDRIEGLIAAGVQSASSAQNAANMITIVCAGFALLVGLIIILLLHVSLVRPVNRLVQSVRRASAGQLDRRVTADGPTEVVTLGSAVESMRGRILAESATATEQSERVARLEEADRISREIQQTTIRDLFALSIALQSVAGRHPAARTALSGVIRDLDRSLAELRAAVLGRMSRPVTRKLRTEVLDLLALLEQDLAITPELRLAGDHDLTLPGPVAVEVLEVLHDAVFATTGSGSAKEVLISIELSAEELRMSVSGAVAEQARDGAMETFDELDERARRRGGTAKVQATDGHIAVDWRIPLEPAPSD